LTVLQQIVLIQNGEDDTIDGQYTNQRQAEAAIDAKEAARIKELEQSTSLTTNIYKEWEDGKNIQLYIPSSVQSKIFTPDISSFRTSEEVARTDVGRGFWESLLGRFGLDVNESESYHRDLESVIYTSKNNIIGPSAKNKAAIMLTVIQARRKF
jgi:hypothetical protein